jgi:hypothetical protein
MGQLNYSMGAMVAKKWDIGIDNFVAMMVKKARFEIRNLKY